MVRGTLVNDSAVLSQQEGPLTRSHVNQLAPRRPADTGSEIRVPDNWDEASAKEQDRIRKQFRQK